MQSGLLYIAKPQLPVQPTTFRRKAVNLKGELTPQIPTTHAVCRSSDAATHANLEASGRPLARP